MPMKDMLNDKVTLVKKDGRIFRERVPALVNKGKIYIFSPELPIEVEDHFLRELPSGLVEDFVVVDPGFMSGIGSIESHFQVSVRRSDAPLARPQTIIANFAGDHSRMYVDATDNSVNVALRFSTRQLETFLAELDRNFLGLPKEQQVALEKPLGILKAEARSDAPKATRVLSALQSIKSICEGAAGNLVAEGIASLISRMLGAVGS